MTDQAEPVVTYRRGLGCTLCGIEVAAADVVNNWMHVDPFDQNAFHGLTLAVEEATTINGDSWTCLMIGPSAELLQSLGLEGSKP